MSKTRVLVGDAVVELESLEDAVSLLRLLREPARQTNPASSPSLPDTRRGASLRPSSFRKHTKSAARQVFSNGHYACFEALYAAGDEGLETEEMVKVLGANGPKSLPPTVAAWGKRTKAAGLGEFRELFEVDRGYAHGKPQTIYRLTPKGREVFKPDTEQAQSVGLGL